MLEALHGAGSKADELGGLEYACTSSFLESALGRPRRFRTLGELLVK
jgi:hypothetical protein